LKTDTPNEDDQGFFGALMISDEVYVEIKVLRSQPRVSPHGIARD
jgi:hypothetical protein